MSKLKFSLTEGTKRPRKLLFLLLVSFTSISTMIGCKKTNPITEKPTADKDVTLLNAAKQKKYLDLKDLETRKKVDFDRNINFIDLIINSKENWPLWFKLELKNKNQETLNDSDLEFLKKWENLLTRKASNDTSTIKTLVEKVTLEKFKNLNEVNNLWKDNKNVNWETFFIEAIDNDENIKKSLLSFFGQISSLYGKIFLTNSLTKLDWVKIDNNNYVDGIYGSVGKKIDKNEIDLQLFGTKFVSENSWKYYQGANQIIINDEGKEEIIDFKVTPTSDHLNVFVHEYGHIISYYLQFNTLLKQSKGYKHGGSYHLFEWINNKIAIFDPIKQILFSWILVPSNYAYTIGPVMGKNPTLDEWFADAFAYWMLTPKHLRTYGWEILNEYFLYELVKIIKI